MTIYTPHADIFEIGTATPGQQGHHGYVSEGVECLVYSRQMMGTVSLELLLLEAHFVDTSVRELLAIASPMLLQEWFPSIATGREVLEITCTQPMLPRLER